MNGHGAVGVYLAEETKDLTFSNIAGEDGVQQIMRGILDLQARSFKCRFAAGRKVMMWARLDELLKRSYCGSAACLPNFL